jgi:hypothetical protein
MAHYSEMDFLFSEVNRKYVNQTLDINSKDNTHNIFRNGDNGGYVVYKTKYNEGTKNSIKKYLKEQIYDSMKSGNPYMDIIKHFNVSSGKPGAGLRIKAVDLAYLRDLGVYPINRMVILRRFSEGMFVPENLDEMEIEPLSTVIGWIKPDANFGTIGFNETWTKTNERFDVALAEILKTATGGKIDANLVPIPDFAQGLLFEIYKKAGLTTGSIENDIVDEHYEVYNSNDITLSAVSALENQQKTNSNISTNTGSTNKDTGDRDTWNLKNIPIGDPNVLHEGPFRDPSGQNIQSTFQFEIEAVYEQKLLGDVDPGSAMLDIIDNLYAMGTSNMSFYWGAESPLVKNAKNAIANKANNLNSWWIFVSELMIQFWETIKEMFTSLKDTIVRTASDLQAEAQKVMNNTEADQKKIDDYQKTIDAANAVIDDPKSSKGDKEHYQKEKNKYELEKKKLEDSKSINTSTSAALKGVSTFITDTLESILTSTISIHRYRLRASLELMIGGSDSSTPWYLTIGNPYSPWIATNHIIVTAGSLETSTEMGFNDQPQWIKVKYTCQFSRSLGKQELMRMFNNTFRRTYSSPRSHNNNQ